MQIIVYKKFDLLEFTRQFRSVFVPEEYPYDAWYHVCEFLSDDDINNLRISDKFLKEILPKKTLLKDLPFKVIKIIAGFMDDNTYGSFRKTCKRMKNRLRKRFVKTAATNGSYWCNSLLVMSGSASLRFAF